jgi:NAD(P)-dependent dehydrogenase (short-subunit alcohol dehydrogenase family)
MSLAPATLMVTGGSGGIGTAICRRFIAEGAAVVSLDRIAPTWHHPRLCPVTLDLMDTEATRRAAQDLAARFRFTHLIHTAGALRPDSLEDVKLQDLDALARLHLAAPLLLAQATLPAMREARFGRIVLIAARAVLGEPGSTAYAATKAGLLGLARTWALELAPHGITVNVVAPAAIAGTAMWRETAPPGSEREAAAAAAVPLRRLGRPEDVAHAVAFFAAPEAGFITGQTLFVCGGASVATLTV